MYVYNLFCCVKRQAVVFGPVHCLLVCDGKLGVRMVASASAHSVGRAMQRKMREQNGSRVDSTGHRVLLVTPQRLASGRLLRLLVLKQAR